MLRRVAVATILGALALAPATAAHAQTGPAETVVGLTNANQLIVFRTDAPSQFSQPVTLSGLATDERLLTIDFRPATARLYGLGSTGRLYRVDSASGQVTRVGTGFVPMSATANVGMDLDPATDRLRIVNTEEQNLRVHPNTGEVVDAVPGTPGIQPDTSLRYAPGDQNVNAPDPDVAAVANSDNTVGASSSTTYAIDTNLGILARLGSPGGSPVSPNAGQLFTIGRLGLESAESTTGFDISPSGLAYASLTPPSASSSTLTRIDLGTGEATALGTVVGAILRDIAVAVPDPVRRLAGSDRFGTAIAVSQHGFPIAGSAQAVTLARADVFADALAGAPLAVATKGPMLLTRSESLTPETRAEIQRVLTAGGKVHVLGGTAAIAATVDDELRALGYDVARYAGGDRFDTAVRIARTGLGDPGNLLLATGLDFPPALVAGPAAARIAGAVLLTAGPRLPSTTRDYLIERSDASRWAIGDDAATADPAATSVGRGADAYELSRQVAETFIPGAPLVVGFASGATFPDGLSGGADIGRQGGPLMLVRPDALPAPVRTYLEPRRATIGAGFLYGGPLAVAETVRTAAQSAIT